ncbi:MAG: UDP-glucose/GDP-mannose dehydrogenase family protein [archaeon]|nr:UDP-glucose/GDP-mannose dehydrogenase family protein [archaeon]
MEISVFGTGYVGLVAGACLSDLGNTVTCVDIDEKKIEALNRGNVPIYEPGLEELVKKNHAEKRLFFTTNSVEAIQNSRIIFIAVGTPQDEAGRAELKYVIQVAQTIAKNANSPKIIVDKSTVPIGTAKKVQDLVRSITSHEIDVVSNPEFLREGTAVRDFLEPDRVVIGAYNEKSADTIGLLYKPLGKEILFTSPESAEMIKYASNAFLATKISFINEIANLCEKTGADVCEVAMGMGLDPRIGKQFLNAGAGYGGSCFPKDVAALQRIAQDHDLEMKIVHATQQVNAGQKIVPVEKLRREFASLAGKKIVVLGLAFKPNTDDMREASSVEIIRALSKEGARICAIDPIAEENAKKILAGTKGLEFEKDPYKAAKNADAIILATEWNEFLELDFARIGKEMKSKILVDARNVYDKKTLMGLGFKHQGIGR